jgi:hypothetical protein
MITFIVVVVACACFPFIIPGVIGFAVGEWFGAVMAYIILLAIVIVGSLFAKD